MPIYPDELNEVARNAGNARKLVEPDATAAAASFECGSFVRFELAETQGKIDLAFSTNGCGYMIAAAETTAASLNGRSLGDLHGLTDGELINIVESGAKQPFPQDRQQCLRVVLDAIHAVFASLRESRLAAAMDNALICTCFSVSESTIERCIAESKARTVDDVTSMTRAGGGCGSCRMLIEEMLDAAAREAHML